MSGLVTAHLYSDLSFLRYSGTLFALWYGVPLCIKAMYAHVYILLIKENAQILSCLLRNQGKISQPFQSHLGRLDFDYLNVEFFIFLFWKPSAYNAVAKHTSAVWINQRTIPHCFSVQ